MNKLIMAALAAGVVLPSLAVPTLASAQSAREVRQDQREVRRDVRRGDYKEAREDRRELREDWRDYKRTHARVYHRPAYVGPRGYRYRPVVVGHRFAPEYRASRYWINDYGTYRLPRPRANARWIRYGNDAVLIDTRTGAAITIHSGFFW
ncbi:regulator RcnB of Ni and Co efflux [Novosphingobium sp. CF614]|uniref:RcnB family protein n=1 Tax=Novosphingobium sp. CF614 TaxID=1884364 RepID=UPI0008E40E7E|nr:RcnB family protein [Novosphingobium sp. CF614]SFF74685.1 regulator RcnB of Ni and Co efflux [Novosphingobium sp. CF614]